MRHGGRGKVGGMVEKESEGGSGETEMKRERETEINGVSSIIILPTLTRAS